MSHSRTPSSPAVASVRPSELNATPYSPAPSCSGTEAVVRGQRGQHGQGGAAGLRRGLDPVGLQPEQAREGDVVVEMCARLRRQRPGHVGALLTSPALDAADRERRRDGGDQREQRDRARDGPPVAMGLSPLGGAAVVEELALDVVEPFLVRRAPLERRGQPRAAVEVGRLAAARDPLAGGIGDPAMEAASLRVVLEPAAQPRPFAQQRLVRELDVALADREQALGGERADGAGVLELLQRDAPALAASVLAFGRQPQQYRARLGLLCAGRGARTPPPRGAPPPRARRRCPRRWPAAGAVRPAAARAPAARWTAVAARPARARRRRPARPSARAPPRARRGRREPRRRGGTRRGASGSRARGAPPAGSRAAGTLRNGRSSPRGSPARRSAARRATRRRTPHARPRRSRR